MTDHTPFTLRTEIDLTMPFWRCITLFPATESCFLLDSGMDPTRLGRFSCLGGHPSALLTGHRTGADSLAMDLELQTWLGPDGQAHAEPAVRRYRADHFAALRELLAQYPRTDTGGPMVPFASGLVGYFGYETAHAIETLPDTGIDDLNLPDVAFMVVDEVLVYDHANETAALYVTGRGPAAAAQAAARTEVWLANLAALVAGGENDEHGKHGGRGENAERTATGGTAAAVRTHFDRDRYMAAVQQCREHILAGDVFEVCLTHRLEMDLPGPARDLYGILRAINPAPFASYLQLPGFQVVSASPERFLQLGADGVAESRPIKGTRPRGATPEADRRLKDDLSRAEKDLAENIMIVDLVRNDLGRVCRIGSVEVPELQVVETYATVHQLVSTVRGDLKPEYDAFHLVRACFPGGSMTGAPKIEAMKIIDRIEPVQRGIYSGAIGFFDAGGAMDLSIVIRTIVCKDGVGTFGVGGAVVADSDPGAEYDETMDKARALVAAVETLAGGGGA